MQENWQEILEFPCYFISDLGRVYSEYSRKYLATRPSPEGVPIVAIGQSQRSVPLLVAKAWLPEPEREDFITPIHLDGIRQNCQADNLAWRPRWFALVYHRERLYPEFPFWNSKIQIVETGEIFNHPEECAMKYGMLEKEIHLGILNNERIFPHWFHVRFV